MDNHYEVIIVGAGTAGLAAGSYLAEQGVKTLLIDAFDPPHSNGSHHGDTRIIRHAYGEGEQYVPFVLKAQNLWEKLQEETGEKLFLQTGILSAGPDNHPFMKEAMKSAETYQLPIEIMDRDEIMNKWPGITLPKGYNGFFERASGILFSEKCILAYRKKALKHGAELLTNTKVTNIVIHEEKVEVETENGQFTGDRCIVTAGAWNHKLLKELNLPLAPTRKTVGWFEAEESKYAAEHFPGFIFQLPDQMYYGFPSIDGCGLKIGRMDGGQIVDPDSINRQFGIYDEDEGDIRGFLETFMPQAAGRLLQGKVCIFTRTPDEDFIIDRHPDYDHVIIAGGFSGHGFKFGSAVGETLANMALGKAIEFDLSSFRVNRFQEQEKAK